MKLQTRRSVLKNAAMFVAAAPLAAVATASYAEDKLKDAKGAAKAAASGAAATAKDKAAAAKTDAKKATAAAKLKLANPAEGTAKALGYVEKAADKAKACTACNFYKDAGDGQGTCMLIAGFHVKGEGSCNSFVKKA